MRQRKYSPAFNIAFRAARDRMGLPYADLPHLLKVLKLPWKRATEAARQQTLIDWYNQTIVNAGPGVAGPSIRTQKLLIPVVRRHGGQSG